MQEELWGDVVVLTCMHCLCLNDVAHTVDMPRRCNHEPSTRHGVIQLLGTGDMALPHRSRRGWHLSLWSSMVTVVASGSHR